MYENILLSDRKITINLDIFAPMKQKLEIERARIELLAPAANAVVGRAAIDAGADAIYIGGPGFGAREGAANPMDEIAGLTDYAHAYGCRVYMTMNTILFDSELRSAERQAHQAYDIGVDALIVQDMAFLRMSLPPIALHASTQTYNITPERVQFLEQVGFQRVVLERGATLEQIRAIRHTTSVELEAFVHGAICVSHSGQCYLGHAVCGRGGNRGGCAQACRSKYDLVADDGEVLVRGSELLSVRDMNLSDRLGELLDAGICSLKIEGRLKDQTYVVNNTAHYDLRLRELGAVRSSSGSVTHGFCADPRKSFTRGFTHYFIDGAASSPRAPKVLASTLREAGEPIGKVLKIAGSRVVVDLPHGMKINNGDGVCFASKGAIRGTNVNIADGNALTLNKIEGLMVGDTLMRNFDRLFAPVSQRQIDVSIEIAIDAEHIRLTATDYDNIGYETVRANDFDVASNRELAKTNIINGLQRSGDTIFRITQVQLVGGNVMPFVTNAAINSLRRELLDGLLNMRKSAYRRPQPGKLGAYPSTHLVTEVDYRGNVANTMARQFYEECGIKVLEPAAECQSDTEFLRGREVMQTSFCLRAELGKCLKEKGSDRRAWSLHNNKTRLELRFDCAACRMFVIFKGN